MVNRPLLNLTLRMVIAVALQVAVIRSPIRASGAVGSRSDSLACAITIAPAYRSRVTQTPVSSRPVRVKALLCEDEKELGEAIVATVCFLEPKVAAAPKSLRPVRPSAPLSAPCPMRAAELTARGCGQVGPFELHGSPTSAKRRRRTPLSSSLSRMSRAGPNPPVHLPNAARLSVRD